MRAEHQVEPMTNGRQLAPESLIASEKMPGFPPCPLGLGPQVSQPLAPPRLGEAGKAPSGIMSRTSPTLSSGHTRAGLSGPQPHQVPHSFIHSFTHSLTQSLNNHSSSNYCVLKDLSSA